MQYRIREQKELKPSGVEWLGDIPIDWQYIKNKYIFKRRNKNVGENYKKYKVLSLTMNGVIERKMDNKGKMPSTFSIYQIIKEDTLVICLFDIDVTPRIIGYVNQEGIISSAYTNIEVLNNQSSKYYYYWFLTLNNQNILLNYTKSLRNTINNENFMSLCSLSFDFKEQQRIVNFLDEKSKTFDDAISKKEELISKLQNAKQSLISEVVTGKLKVIQKDGKLQTIKREKEELINSKVDWLGDIPKDWTLTRLKYLGKAIIGLTYSPSEIVDESEGILVLRSSNVQNKKIVFKDNVFVKKEVNEKLITRIDDILICSRNGSRKLIGKNALINNDSKGLTFGAFMTIFRSEWNQYLFYIFNSDIFEAQSASFLSSTINQLTTGNLNNFKIVLPSKDEQELISKYLDSKLIHFDNTIEKTKQSITKLKQAKEALISEAVTGKIEIL